MQEEAVRDALALVLEEIDGVAALYKQKADLLFSSRDTKGYAKANSDAVAVLEFYHDVMRLAGRWQAMFSPPDHKAEKSAKPIRRPRSGVRKPNRAILVKFANGRVVKGPSAADTFTETLEALGLEKVRALGKVRNGFPLVGTRASENYTQREVGGLYVMTHTSSEYKKEVLEEIANELGVSLSVELL